MYFASDPHIERLRATGLFQPMDLHLAALCVRLAKEAAPDADHEALALAVALVNRAASRGHVCLDLSRPWQAVPEVLAADEPCEMPGWGPLPDAEAWAALLASSPVVAVEGEGAVASPLVLSGRRCYLGRYFAYEQRLARALATLAVAARPLTDDHALLGRALDRLFPPKPDALEPDWQRLAACVAALRGLCVVSGGPGTGKTHTAARILALCLELRLELADTPLRVALAAPTGKAAARLTESLHKAASGIDAPPEIKERLAACRAVTLHRLLGARPDHPTCRHHRDNPLDADVVLVDEVSMVDLPMLAKLVDALPENARCILLGDAGQLSSVEAGAVMADLCGDADPALFTPDFQAALEQADPGLAGLLDRSASETPPPPMADCVAVLARSYRFDDASGLGALCRTARQGDVSAFLRTLDSGHPDIAHHDLSDLSELRTALAPLVRDLYQPVAGATEPAEALAIANGFRILTPLRQGPWGVQGLNRLVHDILSRSMPGTALAELILVQANDPSTGLFNGDIGVVMPPNPSADPESPWTATAFFEAAPGTSGASVRPLSLSRMPRHEPAWAMTVHKSQGSEFTDVVLVLPEKDNPLLTRELVYTALSRAREKVVIVGSKDILSRALTRRTERASGLGPLLWGGE